MTQLESLNFDKLLGLERLVTDIFETCGFSEPECYGNGFLFNKQISVTPGQEKLIFCHVTCFEDDKDSKRFRQELKSRTKEWSTGRVFDRRTKSYILATEDTATEEDRTALLKLNEHVGIQGFIWDRVELTRLLLNVVPDSQFVISRNFSDYGGKLLDERLNRAKEKADTLRDLDPDKAATMFADLFKDCKEPLEAWLVFNLLHESCSELTCEVGENLYSYVAALAKFKCKPLNQSLTRTLSEVLRESHYKELSNAIEQSTKGSYEDWNIDYYKIDSAKLLTNADAFHLILSVTSHWSSLNFGMNEYTSVKFVITKDGVNVKE